MKKCKITGPGLLAGLVMLVVGMVVGQLLNFLMPGLVDEYSNTALFRAWEDPIMSFYFVYFFALGLGLAWIWDKVKDKVKGKKPCKRAFRLTWKYWLAVLLPGMLITYSSFPISFAMLFAWSLGSFIQIWFGFTVLAKVKK